MKTGKERRQHPRLDHKLPVNLAVNGFDFSTLTHNISCVGAYCHLDKYMPPFTKVSVKLSLPNRLKNHGLASNKTEGNGLFSDRQSHGQSHNPQGNGLASGSQSHRQSHKNTIVECKGVVVRSEDEVNGGFSIAIFFNEMRDNQRKKIAQYISQFLP